MMKKDAFIPETIQITKVPIEGIKFANYQKPVDEARVRRMAASYDKHRMRPIDVSYRNGYYWVFDGQHRVKMYSLLGFESIECMVHYGLTYEQEAKLFANQQENVGAIYTVHKWNALIESKDVSVLKIIEIADKYGFTINPSSRSTNSNISAVKALVDIIKEVSFSGFEMILRVIKAWNNADDCTSANILQGLKVFIQKYSNEEIFDINNLVRKLNKVSPNRILLKSQEQKYYGKKQDKVAMVILEIYNENLKQKNRLPDRFRSF